MKKYLLFILLFPLIGIAQISISGNLTKSFFSQGGAPKVNTEVPKPFPNTTFYFLRIDSLKQIIKAYKVTSDEQGRFTTSLKKGKYQVSNSTTLIKNEIESIANLERGYVRKVIWSCSLGTTFSINEDMKDINVHRRATNICYKCP